MKKDEKGTYKYKKKKIKELDKKRKGKKIK